MCLRVWEPTKGSVCPSEFKCLCILSSWLARWQRLLPVVFSLNRDLYFFNRACLFQRKVFFPCAQILFFKEQMSLSAIRSSCTYPKCVWLVSRFLFRRLKLRSSFYSLLLFLAPNEKVKPFSGYFQILLSTIFLPIKLFMHKSSIWFRQAKVSEQCLHL